MKKWLLLCVLFTMMISVKAQYCKATLQASGLTCAMCSNAINKALKTLPFVENIKTDLNKSAFEIVFKTGQAIDFDKLRQKVEDAGFSVAKLQVVVQFEGVKVKNDQHLSVGNQTLHFLNISDQVLSGEHTLTLLDKNFVPAKEMKKYQQYTRKDCYKTGIAGSCCKNEGIAADTRIYHVTI